MVQRKKLIIIALMFLTAVAVIGATILVSQSGVPRQGSPSPIQSQWYWFNGQWLPDIEPIYIGPKNYKTLQNFRYTDGGIEGVNGYAKINTSAVTEFPRLLNGYHFKKDKPQESHVLVWGDSSGGTNSGVYKHDTQIPLQGQFSGVSVISEDGDYSGVSVTEIGRFSKAPDDSVAYCNGKECQIWSGDEMRVASFITSESAVTDEALNPRDYTEESNNNLTDLNNVIRLSGGNDSFTKLMLFFNGADEQTTTVDSNSGSTTIHTVTLGGLLDDSQAKFGSTSVKHTSGSITLTADSVDWNLGVTDYTIDFWMRFDDLTSAVTHALFQQFEDNTNYLRAYYNNTSNIIVLTEATSGVTISQSWTPVEDAWYHVAFIRGWGGTSGNHAITIDGTILGSPVLDTDAYGDTTAQLRIGQLSMNGDQYDMEGWLDEFRWSNAARWTQNFTAPTRRYTAPTLDGVIGTTRPISGASFYVQTVNPESGQTVTFKEWNGQNWSDLTTTGTTEATQGLAKSGKITWAATVDTSKPKYLEGKLLYWYAFNLSSGSADIYRVSVDAPFQPITDLWDEVNRSAIGFHASRSGTYEDYTLEVQAPDYIGATIGGLSSTDHSIIIFEERTQAMIFDMISGNTVQINAGVSIYYWDGDSYESTANQFDLTASGNTPINKSGSITWQPPSEGDEFSQTIFGVVGYAYKVVWNGTLDSTGDTDGTEIDTVYGVPAPLGKIKPFKIPVFFKNRLMLAGYVEGNEGNRIDYSATNAPNVWNGSESSMDGEQSLYIDGGEEITAAASIFNRYGSNIYNNLAVFKETEMYLVTGDGWDNWAVLPVSTTIGCPDPCLSLASAEVAFETVPGQVKRNLLMWVSYSGPYSFDGALPSPMLGVSKYFDPAEGYDIDWATVRGWFDATYQEYNIIIPSIPLWLVRDMVRNKWYEKTTGVASFPQSGFPVIDTVGRQYIYSGTTTGYLMRQEYTNDWDGVAGITNVVETGEIFPSNNPWKIVGLRRLKVAQEVTTEAATLDVTHYVDTSITGSSSYGMATNTGSDVVQRTNVEMNELGWNHRLKFETPTSATTKYNLQGWGIHFWDEREDEN